jgi:hypothetical protein
MKISIQRLVIFSGIVVALLSARQLGAADSEVSGVFKGNDQPAKLAFVSARKGTAIAARTRSSSCLPKEIMPKMNGLI